MEGLPKFVENAHVFVFWWQCPLPQSWAQGAPSLSYVPGTLGLPGGCPDEGAQTAVTLAWDQLAQPKKM